MGFYSVSIAFLGFSKKNFEDYVEETTRLWIPYRTLAKRGRATSPLYLAARPTHYTEPLLNRNFFAYQRCRVSQHKIRVTSRGRLRGAAFPAAGTQTKIRLHRKNAITTQRPAAFVAQPTWSWGAPTQPHTHSKRGHHHEMGVLMIMQ